MIRKMVCFPVLLLSTVIKLISKLVSIIMSLGFGTLRLIVSRVIGVLFGTIIGFLFGRKHIGIKLFSGKKRRS